MPALPSLWLLPCRHPSDEGALTSSRGGEEEGGEEERREKEKRKEREKRREERRKGIVNGRKKEKGVRNKL